MCSLPVTGSRLALGGVLFLMACLQAFAGEKKVGVLDADGRVVSPAIRGGDAVSAPAPVQDAVGSVAVYPPLEAAQRDVFGQLADFSSRASLLGKIVRIRDRIWAALGVRRARPPEVIPIQVLLAAQKPAKAGEVELVERNGSRALRLRFPETEDGETRDFKRALICAVVKELMLRSAVRMSPEAAEKWVPRWLVDALVHQEDCPDPIQFSDELADIAEEDLAAVPLRDLVARAEQNAKASSRAEILAARCFLSFLEIGVQNSSTAVDWLQSDPVRTPLASWKRFFAVFDGSEGDVHKAWTVHMAALRAQRTRVSMTRAETETALQRLLEIDVVLPGNVRQLTPLENFEEYVRLPGIESLLRARKFEFLALAAKAHFAFEPVIVAYADLCGDLGAHRTKGLNERFRRVRSEWNEVRQRLEKVRDYLNWWESLPRSSDPASELAEFYRELDGAGEFRLRVSKALDGWEKRLEQNGKRADWTRVVEEADQRARRKPSE